MAKKIAFAGTFATLRAILEPLEKELRVQTDKPGEYALCMPTLTDSIGRPLYFAGVRTGKSYVSYHLMPIYMNVRLAATISPVLRRRMQGKSCFNFTTIDSAHVRELTALTKKGLESFRKLKPPTM